MATSIVKPKVSKDTTIKRGDLVIGKAHGVVILVSGVDGNVLDGVVVNGGRLGKPIGQLYTTLLDNNYKPFTGSVTLTQD